MQSESSRVERDETLDVEGGFNHRRMALPYRLWLNRARWTPPKRVAASRALPMMLRLEQRLRDYLRRRSRSLWLRTGRQGDFEAFARGMKVGEQAYRVFGKLKRMMG